MTAARSEGNAANVLELQSENLLVVAVLNGRAKASVAVYWLESRVFIHGDELNPVASKQREQFVEQLTETLTFLHEEATSLLADLAARVIAQRTNAHLNRHDAPKDPFPALEVWTTSVNGAVLFDELMTFIGGYVVIPPNAAIAVTLWIAHTYLVDVADYTPYLLVTSPVRECGKTTLLELLLHLANRAQMTGGITAAALYRRIDRLSPTLLLDELDTRLRGDSGEMLRGVLNTGFQRSGRVTICVGDDHEDRDFSTWGPKVLAGIGRVWDTVTSRSIPLRLARATKQELAALRKIRGDRIGKECLPFRQKLARWAKDNRELLRGWDSVAPADLGARQCDVWRPLFGIADVSGAPWPQLVRSAALALHQVAEEEGDYGLLLLQDLKTLFDTTGSASLTSSSILEALVAMEDRPWAEYRNDRPMTKRGLASLIGRFGVKPKNIRVGPEVLKGYEYSALSTAFGIYLAPASESATSATQRNGDPHVADVADRTEAVPDDRGEGKT